MCGISGILNIDQQQISNDLLQRMAYSIRHRGPDDEGYLLVNTINGVIEHRHGDDTIPDIRSVTRHILYSSDISPNLGFGYRRLSILDLSPAGHQPMSNKDGSLWIVYNGEVYNYIEIREELIQKGYKFKSNTDTEVILNAYQEWGFECLNKFNGMWAFAIWDNRKKILFCARDRFGVKPFYYYSDENKFLFASEIKALLQDKSLKREINNEMVYDYFIYNLVDHTENTFIKSIRQLLPSHYLIIDSNGNINLERYYTLNYNSSFIDFDHSLEKKYAENVKELLYDSVKIRLRSDVAIGSCLSGGLDSSSIVCIVNSILRGESNQAKAIGDIQKTFTADYEDKKFSESYFVKKVVKKTGAKPHYVYPSDEKLFQEIDKFIYHLDEPFISTSMYAQWNVMRLAKENGVKVLLDGQGGDEIFGGYDWHLPIYYSELLKRMRINQYFKEVSCISKLRNINSFTLHKKSLEKLVKRIVPTKYITLTKNTILNKDFINQFSYRDELIRKTDTNLQKRLFEEETMYNLRQLLRYEDRNSMAFSIESRVPFVDYRLVELVLSIPVTYKIRNGWSKYILRKAMDGILPQEVQWRKDKVGFATPEESWLKSNCILNYFNKNIIERYFLLANKNNLTDSKQLWKMYNINNWINQFQIAIV